LVSLLYLKELFIYFVNIGDIQEGGDGKVKTEKEKGTIKPC
jgi:hypothetical protein